MNVRKTKLRGLWLAEDGTVLAQVEQLLMEDGNTVFEVLDGRDSTVRRTLDERRAVEMYYEIGMGKEIESSINTSVGTPASLA